MVVAIIAFVVLKFEKRNVNHEIHAGTELSVTTVSDV
jgi:hypothetical protein